jgi:drug/metabolite transporter (DMT)-like permease
MCSESSRYKAAGLISLGIIYVVWGSTYLAIRVAVKQGSGFTPFALGAWRTALSAAVLFLWAFLQSKDKKQIFRLPSKQDATTIVVSALAMWIGGNAMVMTAEQHVDSGIAALLVGSMPIWMTLIEAVWDRRRPSFMLSISMLTGFGGLIVLTLPILKHGTRADVLSAAMLLFAPVSWGFGSVFQARRPVGFTPAASAGCQQAAAAVFFLILALAAGDPFPAPTPQALAAGLYLAVMGGAVTFTAYLTALKLLPVPLVSTYAYVNPVIAVILGFLILDEPITIYTQIGSLLIILGIAGVFRDKRKTASAARHCL